MTTTNQLYDEADRLKDDGQYEAGIAKLQFLLAIDDAYVLAHSALAVVYGKVNQHDKAIEQGVRVSVLSGHVDWVGTLVGFIPRSRETLAQSSRFPTRPAMA